MLGGVWVTGILETGGKWIPVGANLSDYLTFRQRVILFPRPRDPQTTGRRYSLGVSPVENLSFFAPYGASKEFLRPFWGRFTFNGSLCRSLEVKNARSWRESRISLSG